MKSARPLESTIDVLSVLNPNESWVDYRVNRFGGFLWDNGISHAAITGLRSGGVLANLCDAIEEFKVRVVLNEVWQILPEVTEELCNRYPETKFVSLFHGAPSIIEHVNGWPQQSFEFQRLARDLPNAFYGHVMSRGRFRALPGTKVVSIPNVVTTPRNHRFASRNASNPVRILIAGRNTFIKNIGTQVAAAVELQESFGAPVVVTLLSTGDETAFEGHLELLKAYGIPCQFLRWSDWNAYMELLATGVDITFCVSLSESFGLIAAESMMLGIPVVASAAVEFAPRAWQANHQDPLAIASAARSIIRNYRAESEIGRHLIQMVTGSNHNNLLLNLGVLLFPNGGSSE